MLIVDMNRLSEGAQQKKSLLDMLDIFGGENKNVLKTKSLPSPTSTIK